MEMSRRRLPCSWQQVRGGGVDLNRVVSSSRSDESSESQSQVPREGQMFLLNGIKRGYQARNVAGLHRYTGRDVIEIGNVSKTRLMWEME